MLKTIDEITLALVAGTLLLALLVTFVIYFVVVYQQQRKQFNWERETLKRNLIQAQTEIREQTFREVSRELHDNLGAMASGVRISLNLIKSPLNEEDRRLISDMSGHLKQMVEDIRSISRSMHSERLESIGLTEALKQDIERVNRGKQLSVSLDGEQRIFGLKQEAEVFLYRICQELINNARKHAAGAEVRFGLREENGQLLLSYQDNGPGFDLKKTLQQKSGSGLLNLRDRCQLIKARLEMHSKIGKGTELMISLPLQD